MKTLKQIREEYDAKFTDRFDSAPDELMLEGREGGKKISRASPIPSSKEMPVMLIFRRMQYKVFPNNQVVALYYSNMVNKYLSIPFGTDGNLNLSESVVLDEEQLNELGVEWDGWKPKVTVSKGTYDTLKSVQKKMPGYGNYVAAKDAFKKGEYGKAAVNIGKQLGKAALTGAGVALGGAAAVRAVPALARGAGGAALSALSGGEKSSAPSAPTGTPLGQNKSTPSSVKGKSSWERAKPKYGATAQSKLAQADLAQATKKQVAENKMSDLRDMINEGTEFKTLDINGRQVNINIGMAKRILEVYDSVNTKNKKIVEGMLNEDLESFKKLLNFSIRK